MRKFENKQNASAFYNQKMQREKGFNACCKLSQLFNSVVCNKALRFAEAGIVFDPGDFCGLGCKN